MNSLPHRPGLEGEHIRMQDGRIFVPDNPVIPFIEGDGIGPDIWRASQKVFEAAVEKAYQGRRRIAWLEVYAGEKAQAMFGTWLPEDTVNCFREYLVGIKGPLTTPVGGGIRSLNVALRKDLDLYACQRPVRWLRGVPSPVRNPELVDMVIFRENTEDLYAGIEFEQGSEENVRFLKLLAESFPREYAKIRFPDSSGIGIKPVSREGTERVVRAAINYALANQRRSVTLVHKGNIMKYTEGAFRRWGYEMAEREFGDKVYTWLEWDRTNTRSGEEAANQEMAAAEKSGRLVIKDLIADFVFANAISQPRSLDIIATMNLNGDYLSDALAAQIGGLGIAPGGNINFDTGVAVFEATHGTAPKYAGKNVANPGSVILSGEMMFRYMGWPEAADLILCGLENAVAAKTVTNDFYRQMEGATLVNTQEFGDAIIERMSQ